MSAPHPSAAGRRRFWRGLLDVGRWILEREELPRAEAESPLHRPWPKVFSVFASGDALPRRPEECPDRRPISSWLVARELLPRLPQSPRRRHGFFSWLASRDDLPSQVSGRSSEPQSFLTWLFRSDPGQRLESHDSTKEVPENER